MAYRVPRRVTQKLLGFSRTSYVNPEIKKSLEQFATESTRGQDAYKALRRWRQFFGDSQAAKASFEEMRERGFKANRTRVQNLREAEEATKRAFEEAAGAKASRFHLPQGLHLLNEAQKKAVESEIQFHVNKLKTGLRDAPVKTIADALRAPGIAAGAALTTMTALDKMSDYREKKKSK